ncbi:KamA family radical SAM protein [Paraburkholderia agricolaris]|uniref:KamA family radical SAM protein n=1 Tax=Paraburkholderia agricolaris TaxID=2152888 RepID=A0ABW9A080_9BURK
MSMIASNPVASVDAEFWREIPGYSAIAANEFSDPAWQERNCLIRADQVTELLAGLVHDEFVTDLADGLSHSTMSMRVTPYLIALINWESPRGDPIRRQFLPLRSEMTASHPLLRLDSLNEHADEIAGGLVHRYPDRALFLATDRCPVYCRFCTRSYSVGVDTPVVLKDRNAPIADRWRAAIDAIRATPSIVDVVVSGGDCFRLKPDQLLELGGELINIGRLRRIRFASKGLSVLPMKIINDDAWTDALIRLSDLGRSRGIEVSLHTHINHPREVTEFVVAAARRLFSNGVMVRNQSVLLRGVNDDFAAMSSLVKLLSDHHIHPYYTYVCDLVSGVEDMRTTVRRACDLEKCIRGLTAGYNTPTFVVDAPGGGGKRDAHSYEAYDREIGLAVYSAPSVRPGELFLYPDPLHSLSPAMASDWAIADRAREMVQTVLRRAKESL